MELRIKLEGYKDRMDFSPTGEAECRISIDQSESNSPSDTILETVFQHLYQVLSERLNAVNPKDQ